MKTIYLITDAEDNEPIGAAETLDDAIALSDDWFGATENFNFLMRRTNIKKYEVEGTPALHSKIAYTENGTNTIQYANVFEIFYYSEI